MGDDLDMPTDLWTDWTAVPLTWATLVPVWAPAALPARFATPGDEPWTYAAVSGLLELPAGPGWALRIQVSEVKGHLGLALADGDAQGAKRFLALPPGEGPYWVSGPLIVPARPSGHRLILQGLAGGGGEAVVHAVECRRLDRLGFEDWARVWRTVGKPQTA